MSDFMEGVGFIVVALFLVCVMSVLGGTALWLIWEDSITAMFPKAIESGVLAATLTWWQSVKIVWVFSLLLKATQTNTVKKKD